MTYFPQGSRTPLARAVSAEIRAAMAVQRVAQRPLAQQAGYVAHSYVADRLRDEKPLTLDDVARLCDVLSIDAAELIARAWANHGQRLEDEAVRANQPPQPPARRRKAG